MHERKVHTSHALAFRGIVEFLSSFTEILFQRLFRIRKTSLLSQNIWTYSLK